MNDMNDMNVEMEEIEPHFNPGQLINDFPGGYYDVTLISNQYPGGLQLAKGKCIKITNVSREGGIGGEEFRGDLEGKIDSFIVIRDNVYGIKLVDGKEILIDTYDHPYSHHYITDFENIEIIACNNGGGRKNKRTHKYKTAKNKKKTAKNKKKTRRNRKY
jgi:hypothetical protein